MKPALVHPRRGTTSWPQAQLGAGAALRCPRSRTSSARERGERDGDPDGAQRPGSGQVEADAVRRGRGPRRERDQRPEEHAGHEAEHDAARREEADGQPHRERRLLRLRRTVAPGRAEQDEPDDLHEAEDRQRRRRRERGQRDRARRAVGDVAVRADVQQRLEREPLGGEPVQRRQARDRHRADEERDARPGHAAQQAAEPVELERADRALERARAEEEQRLEDRVVQRVQQRGRRARTPPRSPRRAPAARGRRRGRAR